MDISGTWNISPQIAEAADVEFHVNNLGMADHTNRRPALADTTAVRPSRRDRSLAVRAGGLCGSAASASASVSRSGGLIPPPPRRRRSEAPAALPARKVSHGQGRAGN